MGESTKLRFDHRINRPPEPRVNAPIDLAVYKEALIFLVTAGIVAPIFFRLRISPVLGFLLAGVALGPYGLGRLVDRAPWLDALALTNVEAINRVAAFGVVFLLFMMGLELSFERLTRMRRLVFGLGLAQVIFSTVLLGLIAFALGQPPAAALVIGAALSLSSTAIIIPVLAERKRLNLAAGRVSFAILLFQDLAVAPLLFMVTMLVGGQQNGLGIGLALTIAPAALALTGLIVLGRRVLRPLFHSVAMTKSTEFFMAACLLVVLGTALIAATAGLSMALGAFVAGVLLAETEYRREIEVTIEPFKGLLLGLFFVAVGAELDLSVLFAAPAPILLVAAGVIVAKALAVLILARAFKLPGRVGREVALLLGPGGEFAFVMIGAAVAGGLVEGKIGQTILVAVTLTMFVTPALARLGEFLAKKMATPGPALEPAELPPEDEAHRVIIVGYGRVGALIGEMLDRHEIPYIAVDSDANLIARERGAGKPIYFGDATRAEFLRRCGIETARALVVTMDAPRANEAVVQAARSLRADLTLVARARDAAHAKTLYDLGVTDAVPETIEASLQLSEAVLVDIGVPMGYVIASIHEKRDEYRKLLVASGAPSRPRNARRK
jgi:monovalent cation:H+ antiporter-2, CPA2 family